MLNYLKSIETWTGRQTIESKERFNDTKHSPATQTERQGDCSERSTTREKCLLALNSAGC